MNLCNDIRCILYTCTQIYNVYIREREREIYRRGSTEYSVESIAIPSVKQPPARSAVGWVTALFLSLFSMCHEREVRKSSNLSTKRLFTYQLPAGLDIGFLQFPISSKQMRVLLIKIGCSRMWCMCTYVHQIYCN